MRNEKIFTLRRRYGNGIAAVKGIVLKEKPATVPESHIYDVSLTKSTRVITAVRLVTIAPRFTIESAATAIAATVRAIRRRVPVLHERNAARWAGIPRQPRLGCYGINWDDDRVATDVAEDGRHVPFIDH